MLLSELKISPKRDDSSLSLMATDTLKSFAYEAVG